MFRSRYADVYRGDERWRAIEVTGGETYGWPAASTYIQNPPYFTGMTMTRGAAEGHRPCAGAGGVRRFDHHRPHLAGRRDQARQPGRPLSARARQVSRGEFNSYGSRRGNHEVMMRGTFANIRIRNRMLDNVEGGFTRYAPTGETMPIYDAAMLYKQDERPLVVIAGKEYGTGSSRDWAAKGTVLLGVRAVIAESFERIHRSNLVGMGVLPLQFHDGENADEPRPRPASEKYTITGVAEHQAAPGRRGEGDARRRRASSASPPAAASIPTTSSNISTPAASCTTCCGGWRACSERAGRLAAIAGGCRSPFPRKPDEVTHCNCSLCTQDRLSGRLFFVRGAARSTGEFDAYVRADSNPAYIAQHRCRHCGIITHWTPLTDPPHERMGVNARLLEPGALDGVAVRAGRRAELAGVTRDRTAVEVVGWAGAVLILLAYLLLSAGKLTGQSLVYQGMNVVGAAGFVDQRLVARGVALGRAQRRLDADRSDRHLMAASCDSAKTDRRPQPCDHEGMVTYKGLPGPAHLRLLSREQSAANYDDGSTFQIGRIDMVANTGTYVDVPFHRYADGKDLERGCGSNRLRDLPGARRPAAVRGWARGRRRSVRRARRARARRCWSQTGWDRHWRQRRLLSAIIPS